MVKFFPFCVRHVVKIPRFPCMMGAGASQFTAGIEKVLKHGENIRTVRQHRREDSLKKARCRVAQAIFGAMTLYSQPVSQYLHSIMLLKDLDPDVF